MYFHHREHEGLVLNIARSSVQHHSRYAIEFREDGRHNDRHCTSMSALNNGGNSKLRYLGRKPNRVRA